MGHYFTNDDLISELRLITANINNKKYNFYTDNGVFSKDSVDFGTKLMLESISFISGKVLDVGCGYGVIGIFIRDNFDCDVDMVDINKRAISLTNKNIKLHKLDNIRCFISDGYSNITEKYDYIITNPPIRTGKVKVYEILRGAHSHLKDSGKLILVIRKEQGAKSTIKDMEDLYNVSTICKKSGYFVLVLEKK